MRRALIVAALLAALALIARGYVLTHPTRALILPPSIGSTFGARR